VISIVDYGAGNLRSVQNTLAEIGAAYKLIDDASDVGKASKLILPGVGHFGQIMRSLDAMRVRQPLLDFIASGRPFLGICIGMQGLYEGSEEDESVKGLGVFPGKIRRFPKDARVPHMGWNSVTRRRESALMAELPEKPFVYFANSYFAPVQEETVAACDYHGEFAAALQQDNVWGVQFHPEKSGALGLQVMRNFAEC
jgi:imidazole glycerol phosphate synthase glutamine amidotransferase subunit